MAPTLIRDALGDGRRPLPFLRDPVTRDRRVAAAIAPALDDFDRPLEDLQRDQLLVDLAEALTAADMSSTARRLATPHVRAVALARDYLDAARDRPVASTELEAVTGLSRYALGRHFRQCLGTSPYRYLIMRRLDRVIELLRNGEPLASAALAAGFNDQSHMTRQFGQAYGLSPGRWLRLTGGRPVSAGSSATRD